MAREKKKRKKLAHIKCEGSLEVSCLFQTDCFVHYFLLGNEIFD